MMDVKKIDSNDVVWTSWGQYPVMDFCATDDEFSGSAIMWWVGHKFMTLV
jgi:hypothetical protein